MNEKDVFEKVKEIVVDYLNVGENEVDDSTNLVEDLCADSIALVELGFRFSETFSIPMVEGDSELFVMDNLVKFIIKKMHN
ncbi:MAG: acyl carrier protein [Clostridiaceae bacterium]|jgi:acyl carrier protein|nr:acyl carrier protein [Clostridiaceae bacterium]